ncbi:alpha/beta fold hydrolase [uncultured Draconibacterium sp.]|uniref:alpha/beta hydrolase family protein n=1 Tax=uncultured Draconibacterium sp. TaxID=1573823 RepID=UPI0025EB26F8|nr:alpha/beta fold hydrolase [uncultured Draconibacterium sp.]
MKNHNRLGLFVLITLFLFGLKPAKAQPDTISGYWVGKVDLPSIKLTLVFHILPELDGTQQITLDIPEQEATNLACVREISSADSLRISTPEINRTFAGIFLNDTTVKGEWTKNRVHIPLTLIKKNKAPGLYRPQTPKAPFPYYIEEVNYINKQSGFKIAGTLTVPNTIGTYPAVILISGSGAQDRDETIFGHKMFWVLADYFARNGIAVLRIDDRGVGGSEGSVSNATSEDFASDVLAGFAFLEDRGEIDKEKIGLIGHSEGGLIAPLVAAKTTDIAFFIMMAGPGMVGEQILYEQNALALKAAGVPEISIKQSRMVNQRIFEIIKTESDSVKTQEQLRLILSQGFYPGMNDEMKAAVDAKIAGVNNSWFRYFLTYDPRPTLQKVKCPVLAINGVKDVQVPVANLDSIKLALLAGGNTNITTKAFENLNHLFQNCETGSVAEYSQIEETIDPEVLKLMKIWIEETINK